ncbi:MAG: hypothetical protein LKM45_02790 [Wolbachia endosymbiont of Alcedoecus sp.]|nr:hypothetical protein [Wolbachia endosymbiont of Alcedoecus sp.]
MIYFTNNPGTKFSKRLKDSEMEDFFQDFWSLIEEETKKREKLEQELLTLKKRELYRQYVSLATMAPFALLMAIELAKTCSDQVLLGVISGALNHTILPFTALSLICTLYLIYNNRKIAQKEQELKDLENRKEVERKGYDLPSVSEGLIYIEAIATALVIVGIVIGEASSLEATEEALFFTASVLSFAIASYNYKKKNKETEKTSHGEELSKKTKNMSAASLIFAGSSIMLIRRMMLIALTSSLHPAVVPALGLVGITLLMAGSGLITHLYKREFKNVEVGKGIAGPVVVNIGRDGTNQEAVTVC